jgi:hypothetical protein
MSGSIRTRRTRRFDVRPAVTVAAVVMLFTAGTVGFAKSAAPAETDSRGVAELEDRIISKFDTVEKTFVGFVEMLERRFVVEAEDLENQIDGVLGGLEEEPWDKELLAAADALQERLNELAAEVNRLGDTKFLDSRSASAGSPSEPAA